MLRIILSSAALLGALADNCAANGSCPSKQAGGVELLQRTKKVTLQRLNGTQPTSMTDLETELEDEMEMEKSAQIGYFVSKMQKWSRKNKAKLAAGVTSSDIEGQSISGIELVPEGAPDNRVVLYFHGGAFCFYSPNAHRKLMSQLSLASPARYVAVDYRLAPANPFPAALDDALAAWRYVRAEYPKAEVAVAGDSAGGNLAFALMVKLVELGNEGMPCACVGLSPWLMLDVFKVAEFRSRSVEDDSWSNLVVSFGKGISGINLAIEEGMNNKMHDVMAAQYFQEHPSTDPLVTPIYANTSVVSKFPPVLIHGSAEEALAYDARAMVELCEKAGVRVEYKSYEQTEHVFQMYPTTYQEQADDSISLIGKFLDSVWE